MLALRIFDLEFVAIFYIPCWISNALAATILTLLARDDSGSPSRFAPDALFKGAVPI
jgi:hypothetical protein